MKRNYGIALSAICLALVLGACKSTPPAATEDTAEDSPRVDTTLSAVHPLALLSTDSSIYVNIPAQKHVPLTASLLCEEMDSISRSDAEKIAERIENLYAGLGTVQDRSRLEVAATGTIPTIAIKTSFTKKNGWTKERYEAVSTEEALSRHYPYQFDYYANEESGFNIAFLTADEFCLAKGIAPLLENYAVRRAVPDAIYTEWVIVESDDILFYITRPGQYLRNLIGESVTTGAKEVYGRLTYVPDAKNPKNYSGIYHLSFVMDVNDRRTLPALRSLLSLSLAQMGAKVEQSGDSALRVSEVEVTEKQIVDLLTRDPITGKHYKVVDGQVIEESR